MEGLADHHQGVEGALRNVRVLVIDDEEAIRRVVRTLLRESDCLVDVAANGREALQVLLKKDFDVALVDLRMPDMGGAEFLREARSLWPWLGMVILSGFLDEDAVLEARKFGVTRALEKPVDVRKLREAVMEEARLKRKLLELSASQSLTHIQGQLALLRKASEAAIAADNIDAAMRAFSQGISHLLPCSMVGMLHIEGGEQELYLNGVRPVAPAFVRSVQETMLQRYESLSGHARPGATLKIHSNETHTQEGQPEKVVRTFTVPILAEDELRGLLTLSQSELDDSSGRDASFLYHAGNHLSTVLYALNMMRRISVHDALTGVYNRKGLEEEYDRAWQQSRRYNFPLGVAIIDLDRFKEINDTYGHAAGDRVLKEFSDLTQHVARGTDIVARYGGDELVVILPQSEPADIIAFGERLIDAVHRHVFCERAQNLSLTVSVGVASSVVGNKNETAAALMARADLALYRAKKAGRDRVVIEQPNLMPPSVPAPAESTAVPADPVPPADFPIATAHQPVPVLDRASRVDTPREAVMAKGRILVVDDDPGIATLFARILKKQGYVATVEHSGGAAIARLKAEGDKFDVLITDLSMPDKSGLELLDEMRSINENLVKIVITGNATLDNAVLSLRRGAYDFIEKPVVSDQLIAVVERAMEYGTLRAENKRYQLHLEDMVREKSAALREALDRIKVSYDFTLEAMVNLLDAREKSTSRHSLRVRELAVILAEEMNLSESEIEEISKGALLHDIGKMAIPDNVLLKPGKLTDDERMIMSGHVDIGHKILSSSSYLEKASEIVHAHHESWDGNGYPRGLKGADIPLGARIFSVVDTYDAMRSNRVYRRAIEPALVIAEIKRCAGTQFDPAVVDAFLRCQPRFEIAGKWDEEIGKPQD